MIRLRVLLVLLSVLPFGFAPAPFPKSERPRRDDQTDVVGTWQFVECASYGTSYDYTSSNYLAVVTRESFTYVRKNGGVSETVYHVQLDPTASPPSFTWSLGGGTASSAATASRATR